MPKGLQKRVRVIHWKPEESGPLIARCEAAGFAVEYAPERFPEIARAIRQSPPDVIVIDLSRLPSHGRECAVALRTTKYSREIPLILAGGEATKVDAIRKLLPDVVFISYDGVCDAIRSARKVTNPVTPTPIMERYGNRTVAQKLGAKEGTAIAVIDAPRDYADVIGPLPEGAALLEEPETIEPITLWFIRDERTYQDVLPKMRKLAARTKLWVAWRKGSKQFTGDMVRIQAINAGLVDYKICALGQSWSGMAFAAKKPAAKKS